MFRNIKDYTMGKDMAKQTAKILKNKNLSENEKCKIIINGFSKYFLTQMKKDAYLRNLELNYEQFVHETLDGFVQDQEKYDECFRNEFYNILLVQCVTAVNFFEKFAYNSQFSPKSLNKYEAKFLTSLFDLRNACNFGQNFDGTKFYINSDFRKQTINNLANFYDFVEQNYAVENQENLVESE